MIHDEQLRKYREWGHTFLSPAEFAVALGRAKQELWLEHPGRYDDDSVRLEREARNRLLSQKINELPDYGRFADVRELLALRLAPWLRPR